MELQVANAASFTLYNFFSLTKVDSLCLYGIYRYMMMTPKHMSCIMSKESTRPRDLKALLRFSIDSLRCGSMWFSASCK